MPRLNLQENDKKNPHLALVPKDESPGGFAGKIDMLASVKSDNIGEPCNGNTEIIHMDKACGHRNAYQMNPVLQEYNSGKSVRDDLKSSKCTLNLNEKYVDSVKLKNQGLVFSHLTKKVNCIQDLFVKIVKVKVTSHGIYGRTIESECLNTKRCTKIKKDIVHVVGSISQSLKEDFMLITTIVQEKLGVCYVPNAILELDISSIQLNG